MTSYQSLVEWRRRGYEIINKRSIINHISCTYRIFQLGTALNVLYSEIMIEEVLDRGAFGEVCRGKWSGNDVAVKVNTPLSQHTHTLPPFSSYLVQADQLQRRWKHFNVKCL